MDSVGSLFLAILLLLPVLPVPSARAAGAEAVGEELRAARALFQSQELITARPGGFICNAGEAPRIVWRDADTVRDLGCTAPLRVRWFDADLRETTGPLHPGRWGAWIEGTAPNGTPLRRSLTFFCRPYGFLFYAPPDLRPDCPPQTAPVPPEVWDAHRQEISDTARDLLIRGFHDSEAGAILLAGLWEAQQRDRPASTTETAAALHEQYHLDLKLKVQGLAGKVRPLAPPRRVAPPAPVLREGAESEAGVRPGAKARLDALCRQWAAESGEPFATLVARHGVIITHEAFGTAPDGRPVGRDYRADVASITKTVSALLLARFLDQNLIRLDDPVSTVFPDYPTTSPHVPTFRHCYHHMTGISGHGSWGGVRHPHLENIILNALDTLAPGRAHVYSGLNMDLAGKAMEIVSGKTARRLLHEDLFGPLGLTDDIPLGDLGAGLRPTARELAVLAQLLANRGRYGDLELFSEKVFEQMLPEDLGRRYPGVQEEYGLALGWKSEPRPGAPPFSKDPAHLILSPRTLGHGSLSQSILRVDLERDLIIVQIRRQAGPDFDHWAPRFYQAIVDELR